jgi:hypothetical protein
MVGAATGVADATDMDTSEFTNDLLLICAPVSGMICPTDGSDRADPV